MALAAAVVLAPAGWAGVAADPASSVWVSCRSGARMLAGIEWRRVLASPPGRELREKIIETGLRTDWFDGVERIVISSPGTNWVGEERPPLLIAAEGRFDLEQLKALALRRLPHFHRRRGVELLEENPGSGPPLAVALVSPQLVLLGDASAVRTAVDSPDASHNCAANPLLTRAAELAGKNDLWFVAEFPPDLPASHAAGEAALAASIERAQAGLSLREGFSLQAALTTRSAEDAQKVAGEIQLLLARKMAGHSGPDPTRNLQLFTDGPAVKLALEMSDGEFQALWREAEPALLAAVAPEARHLAEEPAASKPRLIRIYGLAEGVREIPLGR